MLCKPPLAGATGAAVDAWRASMGMRLLPQALISLAFRLPLQLEAVTTASVLYLQSNTRAYCQTEVRLAGGAGAACIRAVGCWPLLARCAV